MTGHAACCPTCGSEISPVDLVLDESCLSIAYGGQTVTLSRQEWAAFARVFRAFPAVVSKADMHATLVEASPARHESDIKIVDVVICNLRRKIAAFDIGIETVPGVGVRLKTPERHVDEVRRVQRSARRNAEPDMADIGLVAILRGQGYGITAIAQKTRLSYRAVSLALEAARIPASSPPEESSRERSA